MAKRQAFETVGPFNTELWFGDAADWFMRAEQHSILMELLPQVLAYHRMHPGNILRERRTKEKQNSCKSPRPGWIAAGKRNRHSSHLPPRDDCRRADTGDI